MAGLRRQRRPGCRAPVPAATSQGQAARKGIGNSRIAALDAALRAAIEALVASVADRAAEQVSAAWRADTAGAALLAEVEASQARGERAEREFASVFGAESAEWAASLGLARGATLAMTARPTRHRAGAASATTGSEGTASAR